MSDLNPQEQQKQREAITRMLNYIKYTRRAAIDLPSEFCLAFELFCEAEERLLEMQRSKLSYVADRMSERSREIEAMFIADTPKKVADKLEEAAREIRSWVTAAEKGQRP